MHAQILNIAQHSYLIFYLFSLQLYPLRFHILHSKLNNNQGIPCTLLSNSSLEVKRESENFISTGIYSDVANFRFKDPKEFGKLFVG